MLQRDRVNPAPLASPIVLLSPVELLLKLFGIVRRHLPIMAICMLTLVGLALAYLMITPPSYYAAATMIMDTRRTENMSPTASSAVPQTPLDNPTVETQVEILKSENIALAVINKLKLDEEPEFGAPTGVSALMTKLRSYFRESAPEDSEWNVRKAVGVFANGLNIRRVGVTFVFEIGFTSTNPERSAQIANAVAEAYVDDQLEATYQSTRRAGTWLQERLQDLGNQSAAAEKAVVDFRTRNNIVDTGGRLLSEQQLSELNSQLVIARGAMGDAEARLTRIELMMKSDVPNWSVSEAMNSEVINKLRAQYFALSSRAAELATRVGPNHQAVRNVQSDMAEAKRSINEELSRIAQGYRSDYEISKSRVESLQASLDEAVSQSQTSDQAQVQLRSLESSSQSYRALYDSFLQRYMESVQAQSFPLTEARVVTRATPPTSKSAPRFLPLLAGGLVLGGMLGFGIAFLREFTDKTLRSPADLEALLGVECIASVPAVASFAKKSGRGPAALREVVAKPISRFAEAIRTIKVAVDFSTERREPQIVGFTSSLPGEGKTTLAANFAELVAHSGAKAILVDGDLRNPTLTGRLAPEATSGLAQLLAGEPANGIVRRTVDGFLDFLPAVKKGSGSDSNEIISSLAMRNLLQALKGQYDYVIVDLPPLLPIIDTRAAADLIDSFVFVAEWGETSSEDIQRAFQLSSRIQQKTVGVVLNKIDQKMAKQFFSYEYGTSPSKYYD